MRRFALALSCAISAASVAFAARTTIAAAACDTLASAALPGTDITRAQLVPAGQFAGTPEGLLAPGAVSQRPYSLLPSFCRISATLRPSSDSEIKVELWMPSEAWNRKFVALGNGGWAGQITLNTLAANLLRGYAVATTDTGHTGGSGSFAFNHPEKLIDFSYRAVHDMTVQSKALLQAHYRMAPARSYWLGCSTGGRQGIVEAQRYPADYDAIVAGAPANYMTHLMFATIWVAQVSHRTDVSYIPPEKYAVIHKGAIDACDATDGVTDGVIDDPRQCKFDPRVLQCSAGDGPACLTPAQVETARAIYAGPKNARTGEQIFPGLERGSEMGWSGLAGPTPMTIATDYFKYVLFKEPAWDFQALNFDRHVAEADRSDQAGLNATNPDLSAFVRRGGRLLLYHGWNDQLIAPRNTIDFYESITRALRGATQIDSAIRLFMGPGMTHCAGGDGPSNFDQLNEIDRWVEQDKAPDRIIATRLTAGRPDRTRPLCPYPQVAVYSGSGDTNEAANFECRRPK